MNKFRTYKQRMDALDILTGDTIALARIMALKICSNIFDDAKLHNGAIIHLSVKDAEWITNVARWGQEFAVNHQTHDKTPIGHIAMMMTHETGTGYDACVERLTRKLCMMLPAVTKSSQIDVTLISVEQLPELKPIAFLSAEEIFKAVDDARD